MSTDPLRLDAPAQASRRRAILLGVALALLGAMVAIQELRIAESKIAWQGWGPQHYVTLALDEADFTDDWPSGVQNYRHALPMRVYEWVERGFGIDPTTWMTPHVLLSAMLFALAVGALVHVLFGRTDVTIIATAIVLLSPLAGMNLARFHHGWGRSLDELYYGFAHAFQIFALAAAVKRRWIAVGALVAITAWCHLMIGAFTGAFIAAMVLVDPRELRRKALWIGAGVFALVVAPHLWSILGGAEVGSGGIDRAIWVTAGRIFSWHFFPFDYEAFGANAATHLVPMVLVLAAMVQSIALLDSDEERATARRLGAGCLAVLAITAFGVAMSRWWPLPVVVKMSLHRASGIATFIAVLCVARYLVVGAQRRGVVIAIVSAVALVLLMMARPGPALAPLLVLLIADVASGRLGPWMLGDRARRAGLGLAAVAAAALLGLAAVNWRAAHHPGGRIARLADRLWPPLRLVDPLGHDDRLLAGGAYAVRPPRRWHAGTTQASLFGAAITLAGAAGLLVVLRRHRTADTRAPGIDGVGGAIVAVLAIGAVGGLRSEESRNWLKTNEARAASYLEAQRWARDHTEPGALFLGDPSANYGWRDFSQRPFFGTYREWGYFAFMYDANAERYEEGWRRLRRFGVDPAAVAARYAEAGLPMHRAKFEIQDRVGEAFARMTADDLRDLARIYGVDYVVRAHDVGGAVDLPVVFWNNHYRIHEIPADSGTGAQ